MYLETLAKEIEQDKNAESLTSLNDSETSSALALLTANGYDATPKSKISPKSTSTLTRTSSDCDEDDDDDNVEEEDDEEEEGEGNEQNRHHGNMEVTASGRRRSMRAVKTNSKYVPSASTSTPKSQLDFQQRMDKMRKEMRKGIMYLHSISVYPFCFPHLFQNVIRNWLTRKRKAQRYWLTMKRKAQRR